MSQNKEKANIEKAQALLPWYAKDSLSTDEATWVEAQLAKSEQLRDELALIKKQIVFTKNYVDGLDTKAFENQPKRLNALQNRIKAQKIEEEINAAKASTNTQVEKKSLWQTVLGFLPQSQGQWQTVAALSLAVMVIQGVVISQLYDKDDGQVEYSTLSGVDVGLPEDKVVFLTAFKRTISLSQLESFLLKNGLEIVSGPNLEYQYRLLLKNSNNLKGVKLNEEEVSDLIFDLLDNNNIEFILREN